MSRRNDERIGTMDGDGDRKDALEQAARVRESLARTLSQVRAVGPRPAPDDDPTLDTAVAKEQETPRESEHESSREKDDMPREMGALLARTRAVIEHTRRVIEQTRASIAGHPNAAPPPPPPPPKREKLPKRD